MKYLTSEQAIRDAAYFIESLRKDNLYEVGNNPWIGFGGFYAGLLVAKLRENYPKLLEGALASSSPVTYIEDFHIYDEQVYNSTLRSGNGTFCPTALNNSIQKVESILYKS